MNIAVRTDVDDLRGPGSAMSESIPGPSPYPLSADSPYDSRSRQSEWVVDDEDISSGNAQEHMQHDSDDEEDLQDQAFHLVVVGGDIAAFSAALAIANSHPRAKVTLVTFGVSNRPELVDNDDSSASENYQALLLTEQSISIIHTLLNGDPFEEVHDIVVESPRENGLSDSSISLVKTLD